MTTQQPLDSVGATTKPVWPLAMIAALSPVGYLISLYVSSAIAVLVFLCMLVGGIIAAVLRWRANNIIRAAQPVAPIGHTTEGQPIYPVVGYTPDGQPVTADRAVGVHSAAAGTNSMAIVALITGLTIAPLGIVFGHIALSQIRQTGQSGSGLAIAGLVLGYISVALFAIAFVAMAL